MTDLDRRICQARKDGYTVLAIAGQYGVSLSYVKRVLKLYKDNSASTQRNYTCIRFGRLNDRRYEEYGFDEMIGQ